jgi:DNA-binding HxlR family transcriptional regulator
MKNLNIQNKNFITYNDNFIIVDVLGGVDLNQIERLVCTLRISYKDYPPYRSTLDLYSEHQSEKLIRTLCDKWELTLTDVSKSVHKLIIQLENYRLDNLHYTSKEKQQFELSQEDKKQALKILKSKDLLTQVTNHLNQTGIIGENENAQILFMALASHRFNNPFSVICLAKSGIGKSYILQKLSQCSPNGSYSFHTQISENAIYYFNNYDINHKILLVEDLDWTTQMLTPLATLQSQGKLVKTRATKDKDGMLHSTTFEVSGKLCLLACAYSDKNYESLSLPFLMIHLNHSHSQDIAIMDYQKKVKAGLIPENQIINSQHILKTLVASLENISIINPFAELINLPQDIAHPRKSLLLLLNFIETITFFHQHQREQIVNKETGEIFIKTAPEDVELAFKLLKNSLFRRADELSTTTRGFYLWLVNFLTEAKTKQFTALDIRKSKAIHPRTLNRYLQELSLYSYVQVAGGNKNREGYRYKLTEFGNQTDIQNRIEQELKTTIEKINATQNPEPETEPEPTEPKPETPKLETSEPKPETTGKRVRIEEKEEHTLKLLIELEAKEQGREYLPDDFTTITGRNYTTEARHLKTLWEQEKLSREWKNRQYYYRLATDSKTVRQTPLANSEALAV